MENFVRLAQEAAELCRKYGLSPEELERGVCEIRDYRVRVAIIGAFNTGKSALVNALLGVRLVRVSLSEETLLPTEISYGAPEASLLRDGRFYRSDPSVLREESSALDGAQMARVCLSLPFLKKIPDLSLLDTPGIGTEQATHNPCLSDLVRRAGAYVLVFGADAPVITETMAAFLSTLPLSDRPVLCALTKCDQFSPRHTDQIAASLEKSLSDQLNLSNPRLCRVCCTSPAQLSDIPEFLRCLQVRADALKEEQARHQLMLGTAPLTRYLSERVQNHRLLEPELAQKADVLNRRLERLRATAEELNNSARRLIGEAAAQAALHSRDTLAPMAAPLADLLSTGQDPLPFADSALLSVLRAEAHSHIFPVLDSYEKAMRRLSSLCELRLPDAAPERSEQAMDASFQGVEEVFNGDSLSQETLLNAMQAFVEKRLRQGGLQSFEFLRETLDRPLRGQMQSLQKALEDTRIQQRVRAAEQQQTLEQLQKDLTRLREMTGNAKEECTHAL